MSPVEVPLHGGAVALIDAADAAIVAPYKWHHAKVGGGRGYAKAIIARRSVAMHRLLLGHPAGEVDHINRDSLDNRRVNLRIAARWQNVANTGKRNMRTTSRYKGVSYKAERRYWVAQLKTRGRAYTLSSFATEEEAARAYDTLALEHFGPFAYLNFPLEAANGRAEGV